MNAPLSKNVSSVQMLSNSAKLSNSSSVLLDGLRVVAAHMVVFAHATVMYLHAQPTGLGALGVMIFFLLSGFLISQALLSRQGDPGYDFGRFVADRVARIMTPYVPVLVIVAIVGAFFIPWRYGQPGLNTGPIAFIGNLLMLQDYPVFQVADVLHHDLPWRIRPYNTAEPFWTVAIEFWIYLAVGLFYFCVRGRDQLRPVALFLVAALALPVVIWNGAHGAGQSLSMIWLVGALGGAIFARVLGHDRPGRAWTTSLVILCCSSLTLAAHLIHSGFNPYELQTATLMGLVIFSMVYLLNTVRTKKGFLMRGVTSMASYSYSLYLVHNTVLILVAHYAPPSLSPMVAMIVAYVLANLAAILLYLAFERHYRAVAKVITRPMQALFSGAQRRIVGARTA